VAWLVIYTNGSTGTRFLRRCQVVGAIVGEVRNDTIVFSKNGALGGIVGDACDNHDAKGGEVRFIDYLSLDVEGAESLIMKHFPFDEYSFNIRTVDGGKAQRRFEGLFWRSLDTSIYWNSWFIW
jgi:hypothetical protein